MWYPEKRLFRSLGVKGGRGEDNDYSMHNSAAKNEGISDDKIQKHSRFRARSRSCGSNPRGQDGGVRSGPEGLLTGRNQARMSPDSEASTSKPRVIKDYRLKPKLWSRPAEPEEVRDFLPTSDALFEISKPGSPYENGIRDMETAQKLAEALGYGFRLVGDYFELGSYLDADMEDAVGGLAAFDSPTSFVFDKGRQVKGKIAVLGPKKDMLGDDTRTPLEALFTALHEVGHGIERDFVPGRKIDEEKRIPFFHRPFDGKGEIRDGNEVLFNTPRGEISMLMTLAQMDTGEAKTVIDEIINARRKRACCDRCHRRNSASKGHLPRSCQ